MFIISHVVTLLYIIPTLVSCIQILVTTKTVFYAVLFTCKYIVLINNIFTGQTETISTIGTDYIFLILFINVFYCLIVV